MKKLCSILLLCCALTAHAQLKREEFILSSKGLLDIQAGVSVPLLDYGLSKLTLPAGYAQTGYTYKIGVSYDVSAYVGLAFQYQYCNNPFNAAQLKTDLQAQYTDRTFNSNRYNPWELRTTMIGVYYPFKSYRSSIDVRVLAGVCTGIYPENETLVTYQQAPNNPFNFKEFETSASAFGFQAGIKMRYQLHKNLMLCIAADYTQSKIEFKELRGIETIRNISYSLEPYTQQFQVFNFTAGIGLKFE
jgi:opacity protein-like surface antigen